MNLGIAAAALVLPVAGGIPLVWQHRRRRDRVYARLSAEQASLGKRVPIEFSRGDCPSEAQSLASAFVVERVVRIGDFLAPATLACLRDEALSGVAHMEHSYVPVQKQGSTLSYEQVLRRAPHLAAFYSDRKVRNLISAITSTPVYPTPLRDQSSLSVLCYKDAGDHINWHYDHNFYRGRHFTVLLVLVNRSAGGGLSRGRLERQLADGTIGTIDMPENTLVVFEGARVRHRVTPTAAGDLRLVLSMTYCADPRISGSWELARRIKDTAYYGIRALWD